MKRVYDPEQVRINQVQKLYVSQSKKSFNYDINDFDICGGNWKHKTWKTWMKGFESYSETKKIVERYIAECEKPYGQRNLSEFHLA